ncbi:MAG: 4Fe-4S dicluster protein [Acidobacteria bacterium]|jgi:NAD-dependent dihydropyrimidine dehydrogenase PreA subunit|nr:4Fe-4S dicluster protein [Acidobacteriota bacterium]
MAIRRYDLRRCIGCANCVNTCPCDIFRMSDDGKKSVIAYPYDCQVCNLCALYCPTGSIMVTRDKGIIVPTNYR